MRCRCGGEGELKLRVSMRRKVVQRQCSCGRGYGPIVEYDSYKSIGDVRPLLFWKRKARLNSKRREYHKHLQSDYWKALREAARERDGDRCLCGAQGTVLAHLTYERFGHERLSDVVWSCARCNTNEREQRIKKAVLG